jgi:mono/diheme cytochrome c family protein
MNTRSAPLLLVLLCLPLSAEVKDLKAFFQERCAVCHGPDGSGRGANGVRLGGRNLTDGRWLGKQQEGELVASILRGKGPMPGFRRQLSEPEARRMVAAVLPKLGARKKPGTPLAGR